MKVKVYCRSKDELIYFLLYYIAGIFFALIVLLLGIVKFHLIYGLIGFVWLLFYLRYILTWGRSIEFHDEMIEINTLFKKIDVPYSEIEWAKFVWAGFFMKDVVSLKLKNNILTRSNFSFEATNEKEKILAIFNKLREQNIPTGLNKVGDKFLKFDHLNNTYILKEEYA